MNDVSVPVKPYIGAITLFVVWLFGISRFWEEGPWLIRQTRRVCAMAKRLTQQARRLLDEPEARQQLLKRIQGPNVLRLEQERKERQP